MLGWKQLDSDFDILTPVKQPENSVYTAIDTICCITLLLVTFICVVIDAKLLLFGIRTQDEVQRRFQETGTRSTTNDITSTGYHETLTRALEEMFNFYLTQSVQTLP